MAGQWRYEREIGRAATGIKLGMKKVECACHFPCAIQHIGTGQNLVVTEGKHRDALPSELRGPITHR